MDFLSKAQFIPRFVSITSSATITPTSATADVYAVTALAVAATINAPSGSPTAGQSLLIRLLDNGTARVLTWNAIYKPIGVTLPTTTRAGKLLYIGAIFNGTFWDVLGVNLQA